MGCTSSKNINTENNNKNTSNNDASDMFPLKISSFYVDMSNTFAKDKNIDRLIKYFFHIEHDKSIDIMAIQGINSMLIYRDIVRAFMAKAEEANTKLYFYPFNPNDFNDTDSYDTWSLSDKTTDEVAAYNKLFISRYEPLIYIEDTEYINKNKRTVVSKEKLSSFEFINNIKVDMYDKLHIININVNGIIVSVYNVNILDDIEVNISNYNDRIKKIKRFIDVNTKEIDNYRRFNDTHIDNRYIHIICGNFNINEIKDNIVNKSYKKLIKKLNSVDMFRFVMGIRDKNDLKYRYDTNIFFSRNNYILLFMNNITKLDDFIKLGEIIHKEHGMFITDSHIYSDMSELFMNYPTEISIILDGKWINKRKVSFDEEDGTTYKNIEFTADQFRKIILNNISEDEEDDDTSSYDDSDEEIEELGMEMINMLVDKDESTGQNHQNSNSNNNKMDETESNINGNYNIEINNTLHQTHTPLHSELPGYDHNNVVFPGTPPHFGDNNGSSGVELVDALDIDIGKSV